METGSSPQRKEGKAGSAVLVLEDGTVFLGRGFGAVKKISGEVVFSPSMVGYPESLTDPSYYGQVLTLTYPLIGNYGVPPYDTVYGVPIHFESIGIKVRGLVIQELCEIPSHYLSTRTLDEWLRDEDVPGISGIDTRRLTKKLREKGVMLGILEVCKKGEEPDIESLLEEAKHIPDPNDEDLVSGVTVKEPIHYKFEGNKKVVLIDCGVKCGILRDLFKYKVDVIRVPYNFSAKEIMEYQPDGVLISNGPGDPKRCEKTIEAVKELAGEKVPMMGICLGVQILSLALGGDTYKLKYGHRSQNQPAYDLETGRCYITTQNHGYAVDSDSLKGTDLTVSFINANDKTVEGVRHKRKPIFAVQWHPEASPGPYDTEFLFENFLKMMGGR
ncbi:MAG: glutamine-hydrolyzing carbamoyl-phosphate synthase small subunit [Candidatus Bathyarchaeia archaeon]